VDLVVDAVFGGDPVPHLDKARRSGACPLPVTGSVTAAWSVSALKAHSSTRERRLYDGFRMDTLRGPRGGVFPCLRDLVRNAVQDGNE
jgi:hypothetical protein